MAKTIRAKICRGLCQRAIKMPHTGHSSEHFLRGELMKQLRPFVACFASLVFLLVPSFASDVALAQPKVRKMPHRSQQPIESRLLPGDEIVEMDYWATVQIVRYPNESREQTVLRMARQSDVIAVVRLTNADPLLVEE